MSYDAAGFLWTRNLYLALDPDKIINERTMKASLFSQKPFETESLAEVQFLIDGCGFVSQSNLLNNSSKDCDWRILAYLIREQSTADASFTPLKKNFGLKIQANAWGNNWILNYKTNKEASTVLCSVKRHAGSGRELKKQEKALDYVSCFSFHFFCALPLPACFTTEQSTVETSLFVKCEPMIENKRHTQKHEKTHNTLNFL